MLIVELNDKRLLNKNNIDAYLIGVEFISSECYKHFSLNEALEAIDSIQQNGKKAFIDATQIFHDQDLDKVEIIINKLSKADGFFYKDLAIQNYVSVDKRIYFSITYTTNKCDFQLVEDENKYVLVSPNLKYEELKAFKDFDKALFIAFGTWEIFHSRRPLLTNYGLYRNLSFNDEKLEIIEEFRNDRYPIIEKNGTKIYLNRFYYLADELKDINKNLLFKTFDLDFNITCDIIDYYIESLQNNNFQKLDDKMKSTGLKLHKGLLYEDSLLVKEVKNRE